MELILIVIYGVALMFIFCYSLIQIQLVFKYKTGPSISTPIIVGNKIVAATYNGIYLFEHDEKMKFKLLAHYQTGSIEATPIVHNKKIYVASRDGSLYCFGEK